MTMSTWFSDDSFTFLMDLDANNSKDWFDANKERYQALIKAPADTLKMELIDGLAALTGRQVKGKTFRINRDLRFSKDKTPYNTHVRMAFWLDEDIFQGMKTQPPSFFLSVEADHIRIGAGCMTFSKPVLGRYLQRLETGSDNDIEVLLDALQTKGLELSAPDLAKPPRGFPKDHPQADLARHKGLAVWANIENITVAQGECAATQLLGTWATTLPFWNWLVELHTQ